jgi:hypothetical protein
MILYDETLTRQTPDSDTDFKLRQRFCCGSHNNKRHSLLHECADRCVQMSPAVTYLRYLNTNSAIFYVTTVMKSQVHFEFHTSASFR